MSFWSRAIARATARVFAVVVTLASLLALSRALPWVVEPTVGWAVVWPFARALVTGAIEVSVCLALPAGFALAAARLVDSGEADVALLSGRGPLAVALSGWPVALALSSLAVVTSLAWGVGARDVAAAGELVRGARRACEGRALSEVPTLGVAWVCRPSPRVAGVFGGAVVADAASVTLSPQGEVRLVDLRASLRGPPAVTLRVAEAVVRGVTPAGSPSGAVGGARAVLEVAAASAGAFLLFAWIVRRRWSHPAGALALSAGVSALALALKFV
ncbi:MAG: hypothetical protein IT374_24990 [Polyangiaceae bacterium]|nr:hypothetical protein [Polyangiaceae bacterium]